MKCCQLALFLLLQNAPVVISENFAELRGCQYSYSRNREREDKRKIL